MKTGNLIYTRYEVISYNLKVYKYEKKDEVNNGRKHKLRKFKFRRNMGEVI